MTARLGIMIEGQEGLNWDIWRQLCTDVEGLGFAALRRSDHLYSVMGVAGRECIDPWASLALAATWTSSIELAIMVSPMTFYEAAPLARMAASVDQLSGGRLLLGVGAGWNQPEHDLYNVPFLTVKERLDRLEDGIATIRRAWAQSATKPARDPMPILMGGQGEKRALKIVAREAAEWNLTSLNLDTFAHKSGVVDAYCAEIGRNPREIRRSIMCTFIIGRNQAELRERAAALSTILPRFAGMEPDQVLEAAAAGSLVGTPDQIVARLRQFTAIGVELFLLQHFLMEDTDALRQLAEGVMPALA